MTNNVLSAEALLARTEISILDAARLIRNMLDALPTGSAVSPIQFCNKIIDTGKQYINISEMSIYKGFNLYVETKRHLRQESFSDIRYLGMRLLKANAELSNRNFSALTLTECEDWLAAEFKTPSQFNKARTMLHGLFEFAMRRQWCEKNPIKLIERRKVVEKEILPLSLSETKRLLSVANERKNRECSAAVALLVLAGIRPREVRRLEWKDIDLSENSITIRSQCSKTGGVRHVEICPALKAYLNASKSAGVDTRNGAGGGTGGGEGTGEKICPPNWSRRWRAIRDASGFKGAWVQDVLRHTYASYHAKRFRDMSRLQLNMGHRDQSLLRSRYVNMCKISNDDAQRFFIVRQRSSN